MSSPEVAVAAEPLALSEIAAAWERQRAGAHTKLIIVPDLGDESARSDRSRR